MAETTSSGKYYSKSATLLRALIESRYVYTHPETGEKSIYTAAEYSVHLAERPGEEACFRTGLIGHGRARSGIIKMIAEAIDVWLPSVSAWCSGDIPIYSGHLPKLAEAIKLTPEEQDALFSSLTADRRSHLPQTLEESFPPLDSEAYRKASAYDLLQDVLKCFGVWIEEGCAPQTPEALKEAVRNGHIRFRTWEEISKENIRSQYREIGVHGILFRDAGMNANSGTQAQKHVLDLLPIPATIAIAIRVKMNLLGNDNFKVNPVALEFIFSEANLFDGDVPKHQGAILSDLRRAHVLDVTTGRAELLLDALQKVLAEQNPALLDTYEPLYTGKIGEKLGITHQAVSIMEKMPDSHLTPYFASLQEFFSLSPDQMQIWKSAPHVSAVSYAEWKISDPDNKNSYITGRHYRALVRQIEEKNEVADVEYSGRMPKGVREIPGGIRGLRRADLRSAHREVL